MRQARGARSVGATAMMAEAVFEVMA